jgi:hypothetical protein
VDVAGSGQGLVAGSCKYGDKLLGSGATQLWGAGYAECCQATFISAHIKPSLPLCHMKVKSNFIKFHKNIHC